MNDNDKPDFASKLSLVSLNEDVANNQLKMVCPKCGYKPKDSSDPLLTKHNGLGECPKCGIIPKNYLNKASEIKKQADSQKSFHTDRNPARSKNIEPISRGFILSCVFAGLMVLYLLIKPHDKIISDDTAKVSATQSQLQINATQEKTYKLEQEKLRKIIDGYLDGRDINHPSGIEQTIAEITKMMSDISDHNLKIKYQRCLGALQKFKETKSELLSTQAYVDSLAKLKLESSGSRLAELVKLHREAADSLRKIPFAEDWDSVRRCYSQ